MKAIHPIRHSHTATPRPGKAPTNATVNIFAGTHIHYDAPPPEAHIAPALISLENLALLLRVGTDRRHLPSDIPYADYSITAPHYIDDFIDLLPLSMLQPTGGTVNRRV
ncbi:MAG: hypothetical protein ACXW4B_09140 [Micavibrio sp.]